MKTHWKRGKREREYIEQLNATLNKIKRPVRTREEERVYRKEFYENNKEETLERNKLKITCDCGTVVRKVDYKRHEKCKKHQKLHKLTSRLIF